jgi:hypothetical protein
MFPPHGVPRDVIFPHLNLHHKLYVKKKRCSVVHCTLINPTIPGSGGKFLLETGMFPGSLTQMIELRPAYL